MARFVFYWLLVPPLFFLGFSSSASEYPDRFLGRYSYTYSLSGDASAAGVALDLEAVSICQGRSGFIEHRHTSKIRAP